MFDALQILREALLGGFQVRVWCPPGAPVQIADLEHLEAMLRAKVGGAAILDLMGVPQRALTWSHGLDGRLRGYDTDEQPEETLRSGFRQAFAQAGAGFPL
jgi:hypothetical protein